MSDSESIRIKQQDHYLFKKADDFFAELKSDQKSSKPQLHQPHTITFREEDQKIEQGSLNPVCSHGRIFRFDDDSLLLVQFMRPRIWRLRFDVRNKKASDFTDYNT
jgi:hypothetical protein